MRCEELQREKLLNLLIEESIQYIFINKREDNK